MRLLIGQKCSPFRRAPVTYRICTREDKGFSQTTPKTRIAKISLGQCHDTKASSDWFKLLTSRAAYPRTLNLTWELLYLLQNKSVLKGKRENKDMRASLVSSKQSIICYKSRHINFWLFKSRIKQKTFPFIQLAWRLDNSQNGWVF